MGGLGKLGGKYPEAAEMAVCTSEPAPSMLRDNSNCKTMVDWPRVFTEFMEVIPAMVENCFSSGVATEEAMVSGSAPGRDALT